MSQIKAYKLSIVDRDIIITDEESEKENLMISILYFENKNYLTQTDIFQEIRKNISKYFKVKTSDIRLKFGEGDPLQRITDISRDNNLKNKKR